MFGKTDKESKESLQLLVQNKIIPREPTNELPRRKRAGYQIRIFFKKFAARLRGIKPTMWD